METRYVLACKHPNFHPLPKTFLLLSQKHPTPCLAYKDHYDLAFAYIPTYSPTTLPSVTMASYLSLE